VIKIFILIFLSLVLNNCSFNTNSNFWNEENKDKIKVIEQKIDIIDNLSFNKLKEEIIKYGKNSDFPDINN